MDQNQPSSSGSWNRPEDERVVPGAGDGGADPEDRGGLGEEVRSRAGRAAGDARETLREAASLAAEKSALAGQKFREFGTRAFTEQKERAAEELGSVSSAIRRAADKLYDEKDQNLGEYVEAAAEQVDRVEHYLRNRSLDHMYSDIQAVARRRPEMVVGGMFIAGVALARFLKAGRPDEMPRGSRSSVRPDMAAGPFVSSRGEPVAPPVYPPPGAAIRTDDTDLIPEVE